MALYESSSFSTTRIRYNSMYATFSRLWRLCIRVSSIYKSTGLKDNLFKMPSWPTLFPSILENKDYSVNTNIISRKTVSKFNDKEAYGLFYKNFAKHVKNDDKYKR